MVDTQRYRRPVAMAAVVLVIMVVPARLRRAEPPPEFRAIAGLKEIAAAEILYSATCGAGGYATTFEVLRAPAGSHRDGFLAGEAAARAGTQSPIHVFSIGPGFGSADGPKDCQGRPTRTGYVAAAVPKVFRPEDSRSFAMREDGVIWQVRAPVAPAEPFSAPATPLR
jgi:hypothetical protein